MIRTEQMTAVEIQRAGLDMLARELGPYGFVRFLQQFESGSGDYTNGRHRWLDGMTADSVFERIAEMKAEGGRSS